MEKFYQRLCRQTTTTTKRLSNVYCNAIDCFRRQGIRTRSLTEQIIACLPATRVHFFQICTLAFGRPVPKFPFCSSTSELGSTFHTSFCHFSSFVPTSLPGLLTLPPEKYLVPYLPIPECHSFLQEKEAGLAQIPIDENFGGSFYYDCDSLGF